MFDPKSVFPKKTRKELPLRTKLGWIVVGLTGLVIWGGIQFHRTGESGLLESVRVWLITIFLWLAWPELERLPRWLYLTIPIVAIACAWRPQLLFVVLPATVLILWLTPRSKKNRKKK